jgi:hypothetical protein
MAARGTVLDFKRSVQVDGNKPMRLELDIEPQQSRGWMFGIILCLLGAAIAVRFCWPGKQAA